MKYIFDFDDVLFDTKKFKQHIFKSLEKVGISQSDEERYYNEFRSTGEPFSLKKFLSSLLKSEKVPENITENIIYEQIMSMSENMANTELLEIIKKLGKGNCYIVTNGEEEFQRDKIKRVGIASLFSKIIVVPGSKKEIIKKICVENRNEGAIFVEDKIKFIEDIDMKACPNLKIIHYDEQGLKKLKALI